MECRRHGHPALGDKQMKKKELQARYPDTISRTVLVDFDGTLAEFSPEVLYEGIGDPIPGALRMLKLLKERGYHVMLYSARTDRSVLVRTKKQVQQNLDNIRDWLRIHGMQIFVDEIWEGNKPVGVLIDDMGVNFDGDVDSAVERVDDLLGMSKPEKGEPEGWLSKLRKRFAGG